MKYPAIIITRSGDNAMLCGKPLLTWTIEAARSAHSLGKIYVSTEDHALATLAHAHGAEVIMRLEEVCDASSPIPALCHALKYVEKSAQVTPDRFLFLQTLTPLISSADIDGTIHALESRQADSALAVTPFPHFVWHVDEQGCANSPVHSQPATQYLELGSIYAVHTESFLETHNLTYGKTALCIVPHERAFRISEPGDLSIAETLIKHKPAHTRKKLPNPIGALIMDFDGVFTDNKVIVREDGKESVVCSRGDGMGITRLVRAGLPMLVISTERNPVVQKRCAKLGLECLHGIENKIESLKHWLDKRHIPIEQVIFVGNDINDVECLQAVGCAVVVADAHPTAMAVADIILAANGGNGAIREITDLIQQHGNFIPSKTDVAKASKHDHELKCST